MCAANRRRSRCRRKTSARHEETGPTPPLVLNPARKARLFRVQILTRPATARLPERQYYDCHGKDCILSARTSVCTSRAIKAETIEQAVWQHVSDLLAEP